VSSRIAFSWPAFLWFAYHGQQEQVMKKTLCTLGLATVLLTGVATTGFAATSDDTRTGASVSGSQTVQPKVVTPGSGSAMANDNSTAAGTVYPGTRQATPDAPQSTMPPKVNSGSSDSGGSK
jgi:hypothetical protein